MPNTPGTTRFIKYFVKIWSYIGCQSRLGEKGRQLGYHPPRFSQTRAEALGAACVARALYPPLSGGGLIEAGVLGSRKTPY